MTVCSSKNLLHPNTAISSHHTRETQQCRVHDKVDFLQVSTSRKQVRSSARRKTMQDPQSPRNTILSLVYKHIHTMINTMSSALQILPMALSLCQSLISWSSIWIATLVGLTSLFNNTMSVPRQLPLPRYKISASLLNHVGPKVEVLFSGWTREVALSWLWFSWTFL